MKVQDMGHNFNLTLTQKEKRELEVISAKHNTNELSMIKKLIFEEFHRMEYGDKLHWASQFSRESELNTVINNRPPIPRPKPIETPNSQIKG